MQILSFTAPWCHACVAFAPTIKSLPYPVKKINVEEQPELAEKYGISGLPALVALTNGQPSRPLIGAFSRAKVLEWLKTHEPLAA